MIRMARYFSNKRMTRRWPMIFFFNMTDISAIIVIILRMKLPTSLQYKKGVRHALFITSAKSLAGITANYNPLVQRPVSFIRVLP